MTPFPAASPSALITIGNLLFFKNFFAPISDLNSLYPGVGILCLIRNFFAKDFELSNLDAFLFGPKVLILFFIKKSLNPFAKYSSGPITTNSIFFFLQKLSISFLLLRFISSHNAISEIPAFPGIQNNLSVFFDFLKDQHIECSLAPLPITKIFNFFFIFLL